MPTHLKFLQISESAVASCTQQKKIEELEAQLQEAEDIVKDLREELRAVESQLERFSQVKHLVQVRNAPTENVLITPEPVTLPPSIVQIDSNINQSNKNHILYNSFFPLKKSLLGNGDLPSIILKRKETELYRNGCTQRIRACERTLPDKKLSFSVPKNEIESISKEDEIVLEQVNEVDLTADNSCLTSPSLVKHTNDTVIEEKSDESKTSNGQSTSGKELMTMRQEKEEVDPTLTSSEAKVSKTTEVPSQSHPLTDRVIKYTFQRKRKRGTVIDESASSEKSQENQTDLVGPGKVKLIGESTPEKIRLEQVANQVGQLS